MTSRPRPLWVTGIRLIASAMMLCFAGISANACPFCPPSSPPLAEQLAESDVAVLVKWVRSIPATGDQSETETEFMAVETLRKLPRATALPASIRVPYLVEAQSGDLFLMLGKQTDGITDWSLPLEVTEVSYAYIKQAPSPEQPAQQRLTYFLKFLEFSDPTISNDAFAEFSRAPYEAVVAMRSQLERSTVRRWIAELEPSEQMRLGFYGLLLGLCGTDEDVAYLERQVLQPTAKDQVRLGLDGLMGGYVLLTGEAGLEKLIQARLHKPDQPDGDVYALVNCLRFLWQYAPERAPRPRIVAAMALLIDRPTFAEVAVVDLARWEHWELTPSILARYGQSPFDDPFAKHKVIQFALACVKADERDTATSIPAAADARAFLEQLQRTDPETLRNAKRFFGNTTTVPAPPPTP